MRAETKTAPGAEVEKPTETMKSASNNSKSALARISLMDGFILDVTIDRKAKGRDLLNSVCAGLNIIKKDYFGLTYETPTDTRKWLDLDKPVSKLFRGDTWTLQFAVKFYPPEPSELQEDIARYHLCLQVRNDILEGRLPCTFDTHALLGSYLVQSKMGDYDTKENPDRGYLKDFKIAPNQTAELEKKVMDLHKTHKGQSPAEAELHYLENAKKLDRYGVDLHSAKDSEGVDIMLGVCASGLLVYRDKLRINSFAWPQIWKISYKSHHFYIKIQHGVTINFQLANHRATKNVWKSCVEHHKFFRLMTPEHISDVDSPHSSSTLKKDKKDKQKKIGLAFNYTPGNEDDLLEQAEKLKPRQLSPRTTRAKLQGEVGAGKPKKKHVKIMVITSKFDPATKRIDAENGLVDHSTGVLDPDTGLIDTKYGVIDPQKGTLVALNTKTGKNETHQGEVDPKTGNLHLVNGVSDPTTGRVDNTLGQIFAITPQDDPVVELTVITSHIDPATGKVDAVKGEVEHSLGVLNMDSGLLDTKYGEINIRTGELKAIDPKSGKIVQSKNVKVDRGTGQISIFGVMDSKTGKLDPNQGRIIEVGQQIDPIVEVTALAGKYNSKKNVIDPKTAFVETSGGQFDPKAGKIDTKYGQIDLVRHTITFNDPKSGKTITRDIKIDPTTGQIVLKNQINPKKNKPDKDYARIISLRTVLQRVDPKTKAPISKVSSAKDKEIIIDPKSNQIWMPTGTVDPTTKELQYVSSSADPKTGYVITIYGYLNPKTNEIKKQTKLDPNTTKIEPTSGKFFTATGEVDASTGEPLYAATQVDLESGEVYTKLARVDPKTGKIVLVRILLISKVDERGRPEEVDPETCEIDPVSGRVLKFFNKTALNTKTGKKEILQGEVDSKTGNLDLINSVRDSRTGCVDDTFGQFFSITPKGDSVVEFTVITSRIDPATGKVDAVNGEVERCVGILNMDSGLLDTNYGQVNIRTGELKAIDPESGKIVHSKNVKIDRGTGQITIFGLMDSKTGKLDPNQGRIIEVVQQIDPIVEVTALSGKYNYKKNVIDPKTASVETSGGQFDPKAGKIDTKYGQIDLVRHTITFNDPKSGKTITRDIKIDPTTGQIVLKNQINPKNNKPDEDYARIISLRIVQQRVDPKTKAPINQVSSAKDKEIIIDPKSNQIWMPTGTVDPTTKEPQYVSSSVDSKTGYVITFYGYLNPKTNEIKKQTKLDPNTTIIEPTSGKIFTATGEVDASTGEPLYAATQVDLESGKVYTKLALVDPKTGKLVLVRILLISKVDERGRPEEVDPETCEIDPVTGRVLKFFNKTGYVYSMIDPITGEIVQVDLNEPRFAGARPTVTDTMTLTGEIDSVTGRIKSEYGHIDLNTGDIDPATAIRDPVTGKLILNYVLIDPSHFDKQVPACTSTETVPITSDPLFEDVKHMGMNSLRRDSEASSEDDMTRKYENVIMNSPVSTPTVVETTTQQVLTKNDDGVMHNFEEEVRNLDTDEETLSTREHEYKTEQDGIVETRAEQEITIQSDVDPIDHDRALAEAILEVIGVDPDMTVEKIDI